MSGAVQTLETKHVSIDEVKPYSGNARVGDVEVIRDSLRLNGQYRPIVVWKKTSEILAGNHTWKAAKEEDWPKIWVTYVDCDARTAKRINLVDNRSAELGTYDTQALAALVGDLPSLEGTGWTADDLQKELSKLPVPDLPGENGNMVNVPDDDYVPQYGVIVICRDQEQQEALYQRLQGLVVQETEFGDVELKIVAV